MDVQANMEDDMRASNYIIYVSLPEKNTHYILHGYTGAVDKVSPGTVQYLLEHTDGGHTFHTKDEQIARDCLRGCQTAPPAPETVQSLIRRGYLTDRSPEEERDFARRAFDYFYRKALEKLKPTFMFIPTYQCNMRCPYCYEAPSRGELQKQHRIDQIMTREMADMAFRAMDTLIGNSLNESQTVDAAKSGMKIDLYGGEPLMRETASIVEYLFNRCIEQGIRLGAITNGVELDQFLDLLGPKRIEHIQVTLDGPRDLHNRKRRGPRYPQGTYDTILQNVGLALERETRVSLRVHLDPESAPRTSEIMEDLESCGLLSSKLLKVYANPLHNFSQGYNPESYRHMLNHEAQDVLDACPPTPQTGRTLHVPEPQIESKLKSCIQQGLVGLGNMPLFCSSQAGLYIFDPFGSIYKCWEHVGKPGLEIGSYVPEGPVLNDLENEWRGRSPARIPECVDCKYLFFHVGGCAISAPRSERGLLAPGCFGYEAEFTKFVRKFFQDYVPSLAGSSQQPLKKGGE